MTISQRDIADQLKLSTATVSKSLRNAPEIPPETRAQVINMAMQLGYRPASARLDKKPRRGNKNLALASLIQTDEGIEAGCNIHLLGFLAGMTEAAHEVNATVMVHCVPLSEREKIADSDHQPPALREGQINGLILQHYFPRDVVDRLARQYPCVTIMHRYPGQLIDSIDLDAAHAVGMLIGHLYAQGHRRIGFLGDAAGQSWLLARFAAYVQALTQYGLQYDISIADPQLNALHASEAIVQKIVQAARNGVTAWVCSNDLLGYQWYKHFENGGLHVPQDVSLVGFDAVPVPAGLKQITTIQIPSDVMGRFAVKRIVARIQDSTTPFCRICIEGRLIDGLTTARASIRP